jgi:predicted DNA-binding transcriptional regulator AlpA
MLNETLSRTSATEAPGPAAEPGKVPGLEPLLIPAPEAARLCGLSPATWHRLRSAGKIGPTPVRLGGRVLWRVADLRAWTDAGCPDRRTWEALQANKNGSGRK